MNCPICNSSSKRVGVNQVFKKNIDILQCNKCKLYFLDLPKNKSFIKEYYSRDYWDSYSDRSHKSVKRGMSKILGFYYALSKYYYNFIRKDVKNGSTVLEIGCNEGRVIDYLTKKGLICEGVEPDKINAKQAHITSGCKIYNRPLENLNIDKKYDIIIMIHVLEHIVNLREALRKIRSLCKDSGKILIIVPDGSNPTVVHDTTVNHPHIYTFNNTNIKQLLKKEGFAIIKVEKINPHIGTNYNVLIRLFNKHIKGYNKYTELAVYLKPTKK